MWENLIEFSKPPLHSSWEEQDRRGRTWARAAETIVFRWHLQQSKQIHGQFFKHWPSSGDTHTWSGLPLLLGWSSRACSGMLRHQNSHLCSSGRVLLFYSSRGLHRACIPNYACKGKQAQLCIHCLHQWGMLSQSSLFRNFEKLWITGKTRDKYFLGRKSRLAPPRSPKCVSRYSRAH